jgi:antitoxin (DNA-binding transcriptional repressor) of toxin-antitoxin stability system
MRGEQVTITRHGKPVVELRPSAAVAPIRKPSAELIDVIAAEAKRRGPLGVSPADFVRDMRDEKP